jgi:hypothetical protein
MPNTNDDPTPTPPTDAELFAAVLRYLDERIAWLQQERRDLIDAEAARVREQAGPC